MKIISGLVLVTLFNCLGLNMLSAQEVSSFERYFTWNPDSTIIYSEANKSSSELAKLPYGTELLNVVHFKNLESRVLIGSLEGSIKGDFAGNPYYLPGYWVRISTKGIEGYAFSGEIINFPPMKIDRGWYDLKLEEYSSYFGVEISETENKRQVKIDSNSYYIHETVVTFPDGSYEKTDLFDGCFDHEYSFANKSVAQVYFMFITEYYAIGEESIHVSYGKAALESMDGHKLRFNSMGVTASQGLFIDLNELTFGSYDCT